MEYLLGCYFPDSKKKAIVYFVKVLLIRHHLAKIRPLWVNNYYITTLHNCNNAAEKKLTLGKVKDVP